MKGRKKGRKEGRKEGRKTERKKERKPLGLSHAGMTFIIILSSDALTSIHTDEKRKPDNKMSIVLASDNLLYFHCEGETMTQNRCNRRKEDISCFILQRTK